MEKHLHIICFTVPYPVDYGGVVDLFWKLPFLQKNGIKIHLHCFDYGRGKQEILHQYCVEVNYYNRSNSIFNLFSLKPFIVETRKNKLLEERLLQDDYPILCEGVHSTAILSNQQFTNRKIIVRLHNVEHEYYHHLQKSTTNIFKKLFFYRERILLKKYENALSTSHHLLLSVTELDAEKFRTIFKCNSVEYLPLFLPNNWVVNAITGKGAYCLYNGDLSVVANQKAALWLIEKVVLALPNIKFIIAGKNPSAPLSNFKNLISNLKIIANPNEAIMNQLIQDAHIHILPSNSSSGIKLKLLNALFNGRFCIANNDTISGSGLNELCSIANTPKEFITGIENLIDQDFNAEMKTQRKQILTKKFNNQMNVELLINFIYN